MAVTSVATFLRGLYPVLSNAVKRSFTASSRGVRAAGRKVRGRTSGLGRRATTQERAAIARKRAAGETVTDAVEDTTRRGFIKRHPVLTGIAGVATAAGAEFASPTFLEGESITDKISDFITGDSPEERAEAARVGADLSAQEELLLQRVKDATLERSARGELEAASRGIDPAGLSKGALRLLGRRDAGTRLFGTKQESQALIRSLFTSEGRAPISVGLTTAEIKRDLGPEIPLLRFLSAGERSRLSDASRTTGPTFAGGGSNSGVRQALEEAVAAGGLGG